MCCQAKILDTQKFLKKHGLKKMITVYKVVRADVPSWKCTKCLYGIYQCRFEYTPGWITSKSKVPTITVDKPISAGIHVMLTEKSAAELMDGHPYKKIIKLIVETDDLIGVGSFCKHQNNAVFRKAYLSQQEYDRAMGKRSKK